MGYLFIFLTMLKENLPLVLTLLTAVGAFIAAIGALKSTRETRKTSLGQSLMQLMAYFVSDETFIAMAELGKLREKDPDFPKEFQEMLNNEPENQKTLRYDSYRRRVLQYFNMFRVLLDTNFLTEDIVTKVVTREHADFLKKVIEPLQEVKNPNYDKRTFVTFQRLYDKLK